MGKERQLFGENDDRHLRRRNGTRQTIIFAEHRPLHRVSGQMRQNVVQTDSAVVRRDPAEHRHQVGAQNQQASAVRNQSLAGGGRVRDCQAERGETGRRKWAKWGELQCAIVRYDGRVKSKAKDKIGFYFA